jgi:hypothetical protein
LAEELVGRRDEYDQQGQKAGLPLEHLAPLSHSNNATDCFAPEHGFHHPFGLFAFCSLKG